MLVLVLLLLSQVGCDHSSIPFLSLGEDVGSATVVFRGQSELSGELFVEDVEGVDDDGFTLRRLIFGSNRNLIQSEARLLKPPAGSAKPEPVTAAVDQTYLANEHHNSIVAAFSLLAELLQPPTPQHFFDTAQADGDDAAAEDAPSYHAPSTLVIGLGGGSLPMFLYEHFRTMKVCAVELDPAVLSVATGWFGFPCTSTSSTTEAAERLAVHVTDGLDFVFKLAASVTAAKATSGGGGASPEPEPEPDPPAAAAADDDDDDDDGHPSSSLADEAVSTREEQLSQLGTAHPSAPQAQAVVAGDGTWADLSRRTPYTGAFPDNP